MTRASSLGPHDIFLLDQWGRQMKEAFGEYPYLCGSVVRCKPDYRDVDIRMIDVYDFTDNPVARHTLNLAITLWARRVTGLPIDFQMQPLDEWRAHDDEIRMPMGLRSRAGWV